MTKREEDIHLLKSLSIVEGVVRGAGDTTVENAVTDEISWIVDLLVARLKENREY